MTAEQLRALIEGYLEELALSQDLGTLVEPMRHALGGKRVRPVLCLATGDAIGARVESLLPAAAAVELVHSFSLVHDDLPALDDDAERRGAPSVWAQYDAALFSASIGCALAAAEVSPAEQEPWREFAEELGLLFQIVDDILDGDGYVEDVGEDGARHLADEAAERAQTRLAAIDADTTVLAEIVDGLASRTA